MFAKLENNALHEPRFPLRGERDVFTTDAAILAEYGYKAVRYTETPELADNEFVTPVYTETDMEIVVTWEVHEVEPSDEADEADYINALRDLGVDTDEEENA